MIAQRRHAFLPVVDRVGARGGAAPRSRLAGTDGTAPTGRL